MNRVKSAIFSKSSIIWTILLAVIIVALLILLDRHRSDAIASSEIENYIVRISLINEALPTPKIKRKWFLNIYDYSFLFKDEHGSKKKCNLRFYINSLGKWEKNVLIEDV